MEQVIYFWNRLYYGMYECNRRTDVFLYKYIHSLIRSLYNLLHKEKISKRRDKTNFNKAIGALSNPIIGTSAMLADIEKMCIRDRDDALRVHLPVSRRC